MYVLYVRYIRSSYILRSLCSTLYNLSYHFLLYSSIGSILDRAHINQLASFNSSPSSRNIILKASVTKSEIRPILSYRDSFLSYPIYIVKLRVRISSVTNTAALRRGQRALLNALSLTPLEQQSFRGSQHLVLRPK